jgi:hypothetical protein
MGNNTYSLTRDTLATKAIIEKYPTSFSYYRLMKEEMGLETLPPIVGRIFLGRLYLVFTSVDHLQDLYVNKNQ